MLSANYIAIKLEKIKKYSNTVVGKYNRKANKLRRVTERGHAYGCGEATLLFPDGESFPT